MCLMLPVTGGCGNTDTASWREEVELANGEIVIVKRKEVRDKSGFPASIRGAFRDRKLVFPGGDPLWTGGGDTFPLAMEIKDGRSYIAVNIGSRELCKQFGDPPGSMLFYRYEHGGWRQIPREQFPAGGKANLLVSPWGRNSWEDASGLVENKTKHVVKSHNHYVNQPLDKVLSTYGRDACQMFKSAR